jgi:hypothetical protein
MFAPQIPSAVPIKVEARVATTPVLNVSRSVLPVRAVFPTEDAKTYFKGTVSHLSASLRLRDNAVAQYAQNRMVRAANPTVLVQQQR